MPKKPPPPQKLLPHDEDNERAVLGSVLFDPEYLQEAEYFGIREDDFYLKEHKKIWKSIEETSARGEHVNTISVKQTLQSNNETFDLAKLASLPDEALPSVVIFPDSLKRLRNDAMFRQIIRTAAKYQAEANNRPTDAEGFIDQFEKDALEIRSDSTIGKASTTKEISNRVLEQLLAGGKPQGIHCGLQPIDNITRGWQPSDMIVIAARPGMGKTAMGIQFAIHAAENNHKVLFFSQEMNEDAIFSRMVSMKSEIELSLLSQGTNHQLWQQTKEKIRTAAEELERIPLLIDDKSALTPMQIKASVRRENRKHNGIDLIIIDYLQLIHIDQRNESRQIEISKISSIMKGIAAEFKIPVIVLSQLNREVEKRADGKPKISDLRESGAIEQDADLVFLLQEIPEEQRDNNLSTDQQANCRINLAKHRNGKTATFDVVFQKDCTKFKLPIDDRYEYAPSDS